MNVLRTEPTVREQIDTRRNLTPVLLMEVAGTRCSRPRALSGKQLGDAFQVLTGHHLLGRAAPAHRNLSEGNDI